ncbi:MAG: hypothetical protein JSV03_03435, partial [Planctomycetota bacterium]
GLIMKRMSRGAIAAVILLTIMYAGWIGLIKNGSENEQIMTGYNLFERACAAEEMLFSKKGIIHIVNHIVVQPASKGTISTVEESDDVPKTPGEAYDKLKSYLTHNGLPMCSLQANGQMRFDQLQLPKGDKQGYTITDESWYDSVTGRFARIMRVDEKPFFANSYDGEFLYSSESTTEGVLHIIKTQTRETFKPPQNPAEFLGLTAGFRSQIKEEDIEAPFKEITEGTLENGTKVHIIKSGFADPCGELRAYWLFKIRNDDNTCAEMEFVIGDTSQLVIRRVKSEIVNQPATSWNLAELQSKEERPTEGPLVAVKPNIVIPDVSVRHMVEKADYETYLFNSDPPWTVERQIIDCLDPPSPGHRMFFICHRAKDGRHVVMVQSHTYNQTLIHFTKMDTPVYTSPNGFKVFGSGPTKWYSKILLTSARSFIKDPPAEDRTGYVLESPAGTCPSIAINGQLTDQELHDLIDSLVPAKEYQGE